MQKGHCRKIGHNQVVNAPLRYQYGPHPPRGDQVPYPSGERRDARRSTAKLDFVRPTGGPVSWRCGACRVRGRSDCPPLVREGRKAQHQDGVDADWDGEGLVAALAGSNPAAWGPHEQPPVDLGPNNIEAGAVVGSPRSAGGPGSWSRFRQSQSARLGPDCDRDRRESLRRLR